MRLSSGGAETKQRNVAGEIIDILIICFPTG